MAVTLVTTVGGMTANSYASLAEAAAYIESHFVPSAVSSKWGLMSDDRKSAALIRAAQLLDRHIVWDGDAAYVGQTLSWPRVDIYDRYDRAIYDSVVPDFLKELQIETALWLVSQEGVVPEGTSSEFDSIKVGPIEVNFNESGAGTRARYLPDSVIAALPPYGRYNGVSGGMIRYANVVRT